MADISKIVTPGGDEYNLKDAMARASAATMTGATASAAGTGGTVPAPSATDYYKFLRGNGTWSNVVAGLVVTNSISMGRKSGTTTGTNSTALGYDVEASGYYSHAEGYSANASGAHAHSEGHATTASASSSHAEGNLTIASGVASHAEGTSLSRYDPSTQTTTSYSTEASGTASHAEGIASTAYGNYSHSEGSETVASGVASHAEGSVTEAGGDYSHSEGMGSIAAARSQHVFGEYNTYESGISAANRGNYVEIVGNGTGDGSRSNARTLDWDGNEWLAGDLTVGGTRSVMGMVLTPASPISIPSTANSPISLNLEGLTADHTVVAWRFSSSAENKPPCDLTITTYDGYFTVSNTKGTTDETIQPVFAIPSAVATTTHNE